MVIVLLSISRISPLTGFMPEAPFEPVPSRVGKPSGLACPFCAWNCPTVADGRALAFWYCIPPKKPSPPTTTATITVTIRLFFIMYHLLYFYNYYSYFKASIGCKLAACLAGYQPNNMPIPTDTPKANITD